MKVSKFLKPCKPCCKRVY